VTEAERRIDPRILEMPRVGPDGYDAGLDELRLVDGKPTKVDRLGNPLTLREWTTAWEYAPQEGTWRGSYRDVRFTGFGVNEAGGPAWTVWTSWGGLTSLGRVYSTCVFRERGPATGDDFDLVAELSAETEEAALEQHQKAVEGVREGRW
jgi:hypothetical protein